MKQKALELLGFPLAEPWPELGPITPGPLDGNTVDFSGFAHERHAMRILLLQLGSDRTSRNFADRFMVVSRAWQRTLDRSLKVLSGHTVELIGAEIIRYQPIIFTTERARIQAVCAENVFYEVDASDVSAWTGEDIGLATSRFIGLKRN